MGKHLTSYSTARDFIKDFILRHTGHACGEIILVPSEVGGPDTIQVTLFSHRRQDGVLLTPNPIHLQDHLYREFITNFGRTPYILQVYLGGDKAVFDGAGVIMKAFIRIVDVPHIHN